MYLHRTDEIRYALTSKGQRFKSFAEQEEIEADEKDLEKKIKILLYRNYKSQQIVSWIALGISFLSLLISLLSSYNSYLAFQRKNNVTIKEWKQLLDNQNKIEQAIRHTKEPTTDNLPTPLNVLIFANSLF